MNRLHRGETGISETVNYKKLLESMFEKGLSPKTESVIEGLSKFFGDSYLEPIGGNESNLSIAKSIGNSLVECLNSPKYKIVEVAARVLRDYINSIYEIPPNCVQSLTSRFQKIDLALLDVPVR